VKLQIELRQSTRLLAVDVGKQFGQERTQVSWNRGGLSMAAISGVTGQ